MAGGDGVAEVSDDVDESWELTPSGPLGHLPLRSGGGVEVLLEHLALCTLHFAPCTLHLALFSLPYGSEKATRDPPAGR